MFDLPKSLRRPATLRMLLATAMLCGAVSARAANYFVGGDGQCGYSTIASAVSAAMASSGSQPKIYIANNKTYSSQAISLAPNVQSHVTLIGGTPNCSTTSVSGNTTLNGGSSASVITIRGTIGVTLSHLIISGGHGSSGGGVDYAGVGNLSIDNTSISDNSASGNGGGIRLQGNGGAATMFLNANTVLIGNTADGSGGGISLEGGATMTMDGAGTWIALNQASNGFGGGIVVGYLASAYIGSPGYLGGAAAIYGNEAKFGGGIAVNGGQYLYLYTSDPLHPVALDNNTALIAGGALYFKPNDNYGFACLQNFRLTNNIAQDGTAVYDESARMYLNKDPFAGFSRFCVPPANSVACDASVPCNIVHDNIAMNVQNGNAATDGSAILLQSNSLVYGANLDIRGNHGGRALRLVGGGSTTASYLANSLFADNALSQELLLAGDGNTNIELDNCTLAHDAIGASHVIAANNELRLTDNIIDEGPIAAAVFTGNPQYLFTQYNIAYDTTGFAAGLTNMQGRATFVDVAHGDYRLFYGLQGGQLVKSLGIDYAPPIDNPYGFVDVDIRGLPRDQPIYTPMYGNRDLGAYEMQGVGDHIFIDTFGDNVLLVR